MSIWKRLLVRRPTPSCMTEPTTAADALQNLRRFKEAGITHCRLISSGDERATAVERRMDGKLITIAEARRLIAESGDEIARSVFAAEVEF